MDLIIKPTQKCNFKCDFCSSNNIAINNTDDLSIDYIKSIILQYKPNNIIVNGGDPLMMPPNFYYELLHIIEQNHLSTFLSLTTNLWDYYMHPDKWLSLFKEKNVGICTSFQYGSGRKKYDGSLFSETDFLKIMHRFINDIGYAPMFISVINNENISLWERTIQLAKRLRTTCKLNGLLMSGKSTTLLPRYKLLHMYLKIIKKGYYGIEINSTMFYNALMHKQNLTCPFTNKCLNDIVTVAPNMILYSCPAFNDDHYVSLDKNGNPLYDMQHNQNIKKQFHHLKTDCLSCQNFAICNSCYKHNKDVKQIYDINDYCDNMKIVLQEWRDYLSKNHSSN